MEKRQEKSIIRRSMKDFTKAKWNRSLSERRWERIGETEDIEEITNTFNKLVLDALDECASLKEFKIHRYNKFGLIEETKKMIKERDSLRKKIGKARGKEEKSKIQA